MSNINEVVKRSPLRRISFAWIIPLLALLVTAIMLWDNTLNKGPEVELIVNSADGLRNLLTILLNCGFMDSFSV